MSIAVAGRPCLGALGVFHAHNRDMAIRPQLPRVTLRAHIISTMVLMASIAVVLSGLLIGVLQQRAITSDVVEHLEEIRSRANLLSEDGIDPFTGQPFSSASQFLQAHLRRTISGPDEGELGFVDGKIGWVGPPEVGIHPERDIELMVFISPYVMGESSYIQTYRTHKGYYHVLILPVRYQGSTGALVHVVDITDRLDQSTQMMIAYAWVAVISVIVIAGLAWVMVDRLLRPIEQLRRAAEAIDERDLTSRVPVHGRDDLAVLARAFNRMLDRVQRAVQGQRDLADDVGHELRTPITVVRGHLELIDSTDPADVIATRDLAIDELDRMGVLINDLLTLAKSSESDFVQPVFTEVGLLTEQVLEKAKALGDRQWSIDGLANVMTFLDPARITQAWLQLCSNAVKYSAPGSAIVLGSRSEGDEVMMWVRDEGIGIAPGELERIRERSVRARDVAGGYVPGSGLGLNIVESIMTAHGGRLDISSVLGEGSTFTLRLPR